MLNAGSELARLQAIGIHGGRVLRPLIANGRSYKPGDEISAAVTSTWPVRNRIALGTGAVPRVRFYDPALDMPAGVAEAAVEQAAAIAEKNLDPTLGQFGGITLTTLSTGGVTYPPGVFLPAEAVMAWKVKNRHSLQNTHRVAFFTEAPDKATMQRLLAAESAVVDSLLKE